MFRGSLRLIVLLALSVVLPFVALAADDAPTTSPGSLALLVPLIMAGAPIALRYLKPLVPGMPKAWLPYLLPLLGAAAEILLHLSVGTPLGAWGPVAAMAGNALREMIDQAKKHGVGLDGPRIGDPPTSGRVRPPA